MNDNVILQLGALLLLLAAAPAFADTGTRSVRTEVAINASPSEVRNAFLDERQLGNWWQVSRALVEPRTGGIWSIAWDDWGEEKTQHTWSGVIEELTPTRLVVGHLVMNEPGMPLMGPMRIEIDVESVDGGTLLSVAHLGYGYGGHWDRMYEFVVQGWDHVLGDLDAWFLAEQRYSQEQDLPTPVP